MSAATWCRCGHELNLTGARGVYRCRECGLSTDSPIRPPRVEWARGTASSWPGWHATHEGYRVTVTSYGPGEWSWSLHRLDDDGRITPGDPIARGRSTEYRWGQRQAVGALAVALMATGAVQPGRHSTCHGSVVS